MLAVPFHCSQGRVQIILNDSQKDIVPQNLLNEKSF